MIFFLHIVSNNILKHLETFFEIICIFFLSRLSPLSIISLRKLRKSRIRYRSMIAKEEYRIVFFTADK